jgi:hypothetical protein
MNYVCLRKKPEKTDVSMWRWSFSGVVSVMKIPRPSEAWTGHLLVI